MSGEHDEQRELTWLRMVRDLSHLLVTESDPKRLLPLILDAAVEITSAERGYLVRVRGRKPDGSYRFKVEVARGFDKAALKGTAGNVSRTVIQRVVEREEDGLVTTSEEDRDVLEVSSVQARRVVSIVCVPMRLRGATWGVLYLDHRFEKDRFQAKDLKILKTFADMAALSVETAEIRSGQSPAPMGLDGTARELAELDQAPGLARFGRLLGGSPAMRQLYEQIEQAARSWTPVLVLGEAGTGKELVARELHARGTFAREPFLVENCVSLGEKELEAELFGTQPGLLRPDVPQRPGAFLRAARGSLLLDEVADLPLALQAKLLRVLQTNRVRPVGADADVSHACRLIATTRQDLRQLARDGRFREDLYYRLDVLRLFVPPLRERAEDVLPLFRHFVEAAGVTNLSLTDRARELLTSYTWPGNVRELENEARRLAGLRQRTISAQQLSAEIQAGRGVSRASGTLSGKTLGEVEQAMVEIAMRECKGNKSRAARQLGIPRTTLYHLLERYDLK